MRYAIKHKPTGKFLDEDLELGIFLVEEEGAFVTYGKKDGAEDMLNILESYGPGCFVHTEDGKFPFTDFEVVEI